MLRMRRRRLVGAAVGTAAVVATAGAVRHHQQQKYAQQDAAGQQQQDQAYQQGVADAQAQQQQAAPPPAPAAPPPAAAPAAPDLTAQLQQLAQLHTAGVLSERSSPRPSRSSWPARVLSGNLSGRSPDRARARRPNTGASLEDRPSAGATTPVVHNLGLSCRQIRPTLSLSQKGKIPNANQQLIGVLDRLRLVLLAHHAAVCVDRPSGADGRRLQLVHHPVPWLPVSAVHDADVRLSSFRVSAPFKAWIGCGCSWRSFWTLPASPAPGLPIATASLPAILARPTRARQGATVSGAIELTSIR